MPITSALLLHCRVHGATIAFNKKGMGTELIEGGPMEPYARGAVKTSRQSLRLRSANECRQCGAPISIPEWSEWLDAGCARHLWQCDACGYSFETTVYFAAA